MIRQQVLHVRGGAVTRAKRNHENLAQMFPVNRSVPLSGLQISGDKTIK